MKKTVVISGANRGIGLELVKVFSHGGFHVVAGVRHVAADSALVAFAKESRCQVLPLDVTNEESVQRFASTFEGHVDILVNNAGVLSQHETSLEDVSLDEIVQMYSTNVIGSLRLTKAMLPKLQVSQRGIVVNISSLMGSLADNNRSGRAYGYRMSKAAMNMFTRSLAVDFPRLISVSLHPGWVSTDMGGPEAPVKPHESAAGLFKVIANLKSEHSGHFFNFRGEALPW